MEEKHKLLAKISTLHRLESPLDDDETRRIMRRLYQNLEKWVMRHFSNATSASFIDHNYSIYDTQELVHREILEGVFQGIWAPFMIGFQGSFADYSLRQLDKHIHQSSE